MLDDRIRVFEGRLQRYGTQYDWNDAGTAMVPMVGVEDPETVDAFEIGGKYSAGGILFNFALFRQEFKNVSQKKPKASRDRSSETFIVGIGLKKA